MTKVEINALTETGRLALRIHVEEEIDFRAKAKRIPKFMRPKQLKVFMKSSSEFIKNDDGEYVQHVITNFQDGGENVRASFYNNVKAAFLENGATIEDFEVKFIDE